MPLQWGKLPELTTAPYYLTLKSNGCLILIAALTPTSLLVTSKHAIGQAKEAGSVSHAEMGERWLDRHLASTGKTRQDLAHRLWKENWTLVAELCDDTFEEHILAYPADKSGLHLHGIVCNHPTLLTLPPSHVNQVASEFGLIETPYLTLSSIDEVRSFTDDIAKTGMWQGVHVEGFVVRAALKPGSLEKQPLPNDLTEENWIDERRVFMWKIKFDQPYLMWREWREVTKKILTSKKKAADDIAERGKQVFASRSDEGRGRTQEQPIVATNGSTHIAESEDVEFVGNTEGLADSTSNGKKSKEDKKKQPAAASAQAKAPVDAIRLDRIRNPETRLYISWLEGHMQFHPEAFAEYANNKGIIAVREAFLQWRKTEEGKKAEEDAMGTEAASKKERLAEAPFEKTLIVPVAVPGCGKQHVAISS